MIATLWRRHRYLLIAFVLAVAAAVFLGVRAVMFTIYWSDPANRDQAIEGWMTPRFVAHSWDVPSELVARSLGLERDGGGRRITIDEIAAMRGVSVGELSDALVADIESFRAAR